jgi:hypothetical protein
MATDWRRAGHHDWPEFLREWAEPGDLRRRRRIEQPRAVRQARHRGHERSTIDESGSA